MKRKSGKRIQDPVVNVKSKYNVNEDIVCESLRVIASDGEVVGVLTRKEALAVAVETGLDLVQVGSADGDGNGTAKIIDFGKFLYEKKKAQGEAKKKHKPVEIKEIKMRPNIDVGDYTFKVNRVVEFVDAGKLVKITLQFRGREIASKEAVGSKLFLRISEDVGSKISCAGVEYGKESKGTSVWTRVMNGIYKK